MSRSVSARSNCSAPHRAPIEDATASAGSTTIATPPVLYAALVPLAAAAAAAPAADVTKTAEPTFTKADVETLVKSAIDELKKTLTPAAPVAADPTAKVKLIGRDGNEITKTVSAGSGNLQDTGI